jgi:hypothetical protein
VGNRIRKTFVEIRRLSPAEADVWIRAVVEWVTPGTELRGRLVGPRCPGVTTMEVPYLLHPLQQRDVDLDNTLIARAVIPEPNLWTAETPFVYEGSLELWQDGERCDVVKLSVGLRFSDSSIK